ncbi:MAG: sigma-54-dependent Fis family transcriptional regulator [Spirochaetales bacterium]|nr:sigma-54-dependent Fis family transcriptional regulator [Spirochaetales bacterium]
MLNHGSRALISRGSSSGVMAGEVILLHDISEVLNSQDNKNSILKNILFLMSEHMGMIKGGGTIIENGIDDIIFKESVNMDYLEADYELDSFDSIMRRIVISGRPVAVPETEVGFELISDGDLHSVWSKENMSCFCVPVLHGGAVKGVLFSDQHFGVDLSIEQTLLLLSTISSMISSSIIVDEPLFSGSAETYGSSFLNLITDNGDVPDDSSCGEFHKDDFIQDAAANDWSFIIKCDDKAQRESLAREIHYSSNRREHPFIYCDCSKLSEEGSAAEIFGRTRSAFLGGVKSKIGLLDKGADGTLFLDNIGSLSLNVQARVLKVLEEGVFYPMGSSEIRTVDIRVIAGTSRNLIPLSENGRFNIGLFSCFQNHTVAMASGEVSMVSTSPVSLEPDMQEEEAGIINLPFDVGDSSLQEALDVLEYELITRKLRLTRGNVSRAAEELGLTQRILGLRLKKYEIDYRDFRKKVG